MIFCRWLIELKRIYKKEEKKSAQHPLTEVLNRHKSTNSNKITRDLHLYKQDHNRPVIFHFWNTADHSKQQALLSNTVPGRISLRPCVKSSVLNYTRQAQSKHACVWKRRFANSKERSALLTQARVLPPITQTLTFSVDLLRDCLHSVPCWVQYSTQPALSSRGGHASPPFLGSWMTCLLRTRYVVLQGSAQPLQTLHWDTTQGITGGRVTNQDGEGYRSDASDVPSPEKTLLDIAQYNIPYFTPVPQLCWAVPTSSAPRKLPAQKLQSSRLAYVGLSHLSFLHHCKPPPQTGTCTG